jgi:hypothetical protein
MGRTERRRSRTGTRGGARDGEGEADARVLDRAEAASRRGDEGGDRG